MEQCISENSVLPENLLEGSKCPPSAWPTQEAPGLKMWPVCLCFIPFQLMYMGMEIVRGPGQNTHVCLSVALRSLWRGPSELIPPGPPAL